MQRVAFVAVFAVDSPALWSDVSSLSSNVSLHGLENSRLNPSRSVPFRLFLGQKVEVFGGLRGQTDRNYGFPVSHDPPEVEDNNKHSSVGFQIGGGCMGAVRAGARY